MTVLASYTTASDMTVTDEFGVQHVLFQNDDIIISLLRGTDASQSAAVKPTIPEGSIALCDILLDRTTADRLAWTETSHAGRSAHPMNCERKTSCYGTRSARFKPTLAATLQSPDKGPTPSATSTDALQVDATWAAGTVPTGAPAIDKSKFRQRQAGENWADSRTTTLGDVQEYSFDVPDADSVTCRCRSSMATKTASARGANTGTIDAGDITRIAVALMTHTFNTAGAAFACVALLRRATRARLTLTGGSGGDGGGGAGGGGSGGGDHLQRRRRSRRRSERWSGQ